MISEPFFFMKIIEEVEHQVIKLEHDKQLLIDQEHVAAADKKVKQLFYKEFGLVVPEYQFIQDFESFYIQSKEETTAIYLFNKETLFTYLEDSNLLNLYFFKGVSYFNQLLSR
ncbi:hypothetical protein [Listeria innocua]|uniref:hypothetical protein n=1 Tax=Listeria innocua TaxID=1642 RepID=UPI00162A1571|nr:hypothetical protein [Listeria innocua]MBC1337510.1 hypothetical protein [Listeria innocua]